MQKPKDEEWTVPKLHYMLGKYISTMEMAGNESSDALTPTSGTYPNSANQRNRPPSFKPTTGGLIVGSNSRGSSSHREFQAKCVYCTQSHWSDQCPNYSILDARKEKLKGSSYNCIQRGAHLKRLYKG